MSQYSEFPTPPTGEFTAEPSVTDVARDEATDVAQHARQAGGQVTQTATDQTRQVAAETSRQVHGLFGEAQDQVRDQASAQQQKAAQRLRSVADELGQMADQGGQSGMATDLARQAAGRLHGAAVWLEKREPADLLAEVRDFARRRPGTFLLGAAVAGLAAGRITRGLTPKHDEQQAASGNAGPLYPAAPADGASWAAPAVAEPVDASVPVYPVDPIAAPEPGWAPNSEGSI
jgi:hypothetical protein